MGVQIIITGNYASDAISELQLLSLALLPKQAPLPEQIIFRTSTMGVGVGAPTSEQMEAEARKVNDAIVDIKVGVAPENDNVEPTKPKRVRVKKVAKAEVVTEIAPEAPIEVVVDGDRDEIESPVPAEPSKELVVTRELIRATMAKVGKGADGIDIPANYAKIRTIFKSLIPAGKEIKVINIPDEKLSQAYYEIAAI